jgi:hypothetical protein
MRRMLLIVMLIPGVTFGADELGRLFTTPAQRESLNHLRAITPKLDPATASLSEEMVTQVLQPVLPSSISVQGYVKRSDGKKGTVWVNDTPMQENSSTGEVAVGNLRKGNQVQIKVPGLDRDLNLKAGQVYIPETDSVVEINAHRESSPASSDVGTIGGDAPLAVPLPEQAAEINP